MTEHAETKPQPVEKNPDAGSFQPPPAAEQLAAALAKNGGPRDWRRWKASAIEEVVHLASAAPRMEILGIDLLGDLRVAYKIDMPVPRFPRGDRLAVGSVAVFDLLFQESWRWESPPPAMPLAVLQPFDTFHPNVRPFAIPPAGLRGVFQMPRAIFCIGNLPPGTPPKEIVLSGYFALSLQDYVLDERDPAGVFNKQACEYLRMHDEYLPLTAAGLLDPWQPEGETQ